MEFKNWIIRNKSWFNSFFFSTIMFSVITSCNSIENENINNKDVLGKNYSVPLDSLFLDLTQVENFEYEKNPIIDGLVSSSDGSQGFIKTFVKKTEGEGVLNVELSLYDYSDIISSKISFNEKKTNFFSKKIKDEKTGLEKKNPYYSRKIDIEKIGDDSFCYEFVSPTVVVLYNKYIIECDVTISHTLLNLSEDNSFTLKKSIEIVKKQIEKLKLMNIE
jgi:hypothetical protein